MMNVLAIFSTLMAVALGFHTGGHSGSHGGFSDAIKRPVVSRRDVAAVTQDDLYDVIKEVVAQAHAGTTSEDLTQAAVKVIAQVDSLLASDNSPVDPSDVRKLIEVSSAQFGAKTAVSAIFDDAMTVQGEKMAAALRLWDSLVDTAREQQAAGQSTRVTLTAIKDTARAMQAIVTDTVSYVTDILRLAGTNQGTSNNKRALSKRGWSVGVDVGYGSHSGGRVGVSVGFSF